MKESNIIGYTGDTGNAENVVNPHLHFEIAMNPRYNRSTAYDTQTNRLGFKIKQLAQNKVMRMCNGLYLRDVDEQKFIDAMHKFNFNKQITGKHKKKFDNATQEIKGTLHDFHLHSGFDDSSIKEIK